MPGDAPTPLKPRLAISIDQPQAIAGRVAPRSSVLGITELHGGEISAVFEIALQDAPSCILKVYPASLLVAPRGKLRLSGIVDFENATACDPLMDIAKALYYFTPQDAPKRAGLLAGYGAIARPDWQDTVDLYRLHCTLELWCWMAQIGKRDALTGLTKELENVG